MLDGCSEELEVSGKPLPQEKMADLVGVRKRNCLAVRLYKTRHPERKRAYERARRARWIAHGLCSYCGKVPALSGYRQCSLCLANDRRRAAMRSPEQRQHANARACMRNRLTGCRRITVSRWRRKLKQEVLSAYGGQCRCCGEKHFEFLTLDHVNNDGAKHRRELGKVTAVYRWAKMHNYPSTLQVLCWNCNCAKQYFKVCPHTVEAVSLIS